MHKLCLMNQTDVSLQRINIFKGQNINQARRNTIEFIENLKLHYINPKGNFILSPQEQRQGIEKKTKEPIKELFSHQAFILFKIDVCIIYEIESPFTYSITNVF